MTPIRYFRPASPGMALRAFAVVLILGASACASNSSSKDSPELALQAAEQAIGNAERAEAGASAANELAEARSKLVAAHQANRDKHVQLARRLAQQARIDAELAIAMHDVAKARSVNNALREGHRNVEPGRHAHPGDHQ